jgi:hypothetical protein
MISNLIDCLKTRRSERIKIRYGKSSTKSDLFDFFRNGLNYLNDLNVLNLS